MDLWLSKCTHSRAFYTWGFHEAAVCFWCTNWLGGENAILWNHLHMNWHISLCSLLCIGWFSLPGWPQMRGRSWCWVALGSPSLRVWLKTERTDVFNSVPVHTLGLTIALTGTRSHFRADRKREGLRKRERERGGETLWDQKTEKKLKQGEETQLVILNLQHGFLWQTHTQSLSSTG